MDNRISPTRAVKRRWHEIRHNYVDDENVLHVDAWETDDDNEEGKTIAWICMDTGKVIYGDPVARIDTTVQEIIMAVLNNIRVNEPLSEEEIENEDVVYAEKAGSKECGWRLVLHKRFSPEMKTEVTNYSGARMYVSSLIRAGWKFYRKERHET